MAHERETRWRSGLIYACLNDRISASHRSCSRSDAAANAGGDAYWIIQTNRESDVAVPGAVERAGRDPLRMLISHYA